jgi:hypothetical protein
VARCVIVMQKPLSLSLIAPLPISTIQSVKQYKLGDLCKKLCLSNLIVLIIYIILHNKDNKDKDNKYKKIFALHVKYYK